MANTTRSLSHISPDDLPFVEWVINNADSSVLNDLDSTRAIIHWARGGEIEYLKPSTGEWVICNNPKFLPDRDYRVPAAADTQKPASEPPTPQGPECAGCAGTCGEANSAEGVTPADMMDLGPVTVYAYPGAVVNVYVNN